MSNPFNRIKLPNIYFGWWIAIISSIFFPLTSGYLNQGASVIFKSLSADLDLSRAATSIASGIGALQAIITFPLAGWLSDKYGSKYLVITGCFVMGIGLILMNFVQSAWQYYIVWGVLISGSATFGFSVSIDNMVTKWFVKKRGLAFSIRFTIIALMSMIMFPLISLLVTEYQWRTTALIWSCIAFASIPIAFLLVRQQRPEFYGLLPDGEKAGSIAPVNVKEKSTISVTDGFEEQNFTLKQALNTPAYWMLTAVLVIYSAVQAGLMIHLIPMFTDTGFSLVKAGNLVALMAFFGLPSRFIVGVIADRIGKNKIKYLTVGMLLLMAGGLWTLVINPDFPGRIYFFLVLFGIGSAPMIPLDILIRSRFYGSKAYGSIQSISMMFSAPVSFLAPIFSGMVYDTTGNYLQAIIVFAVLSSVAAVIMLLVSVPRRL